MIDRSYCCLFAFRLSKSLLLHAARSLSRSRPRSPRTLSARLDDDRSPVLPKTMPEPNNHSIPQPAVLPPILLVRGAIKLYVLDILKGRMCQSFEDG